MTNIQNWSKLPSKTLDEYSRVGYTVSVPELRTTKKLVDIHGVYQLAPDRARKVFKTMVTLEQIKSNLSDVTNEQIGKCHKVWDHQTGEDFYLVENESGDFNEDGELIEYKVQYTSQYGFTCTCKAGQVGFSRITVHPSGVCKHVRWAVACWLEEEAAMQELNEREKAAKEKGTLQHPQELPVVHKMSSIESQVPAWIMNARPAPHMRYAPKELR